MLESFTKNNLFAVLTFVLAKLSGLSGVVLGFSKVHHALGGKLLILAGLLLMTTIVLCVVEMRRQNKQDQNNKNIINEMLKNGLLQEQLKAAGYKLVVNNR